MVASEERLFDMLCCQSTLLDFTQYRKYGIYVFRFYKNSLPYFVIIDDRVPCMQKLDSQPVPYFARCENANFFWVSLIEKAFAKLHGRYFALEQGKVENALTDMLGVTTEDLHIDPFEQTDPGKLFECLKVLSYNHCIVGCTLSNEHVNQLGNEAKTKHQNLERTAKASGIIAGYTYSLLDVRELTVAGKLTRLVRLRNPWAGGQEWTGAFSDLDDVWSPDLKKQLNTQDIQEGQKTSSRFSHAWNQGDGIFLMKIEDFMSCFNQISICRDFPDNFNGIKYEGEWNPSYGFPHPKNVKWLSNPQYIFSFHSFSAKETRVCIQLSQKDPRFIPTLRPPFKKQMCGLGMVLMKMGSVQLQIKTYNPRDLVLIKKAKTHRTVYVSTILTPGKYCLIPLTKYSGDCT